MAEWEAAQAAAERLADQACGTADGAGVGLARADGYLVTTWLAAEPERLLAERAEGYDEGWQACLRQWDPEHRPNADRLPERNPHTAELARRTAAQPEQGDPADYGYDELPIVNGVRVIPNVEPEDVICRACGQPATQHAAGRFSVYGLCPPADPDGRRWLGHQADGPGPTCQHCGLPVAHHREQP